MTKYAKFEGISIKNDSRIECKSWHKYLYFLWDGLYLLASTLSGDPDFDHDGPDRSDSSSPTIFEYLILPLYFSRALFKRKDNLLVKLTYQRRSPPWLQEINIKQNTEWYFDKER